MKATRLANDSTANDSMANGSTANGSTDWNNIFQMHVQGSSWPEVGCKIPEVQFNLKNKLEIYSAINCETVNLGYDQLPTLKLDTWMNNIKILQKLESIDLC